MALRDILGQDKAIAIIQRTMARDRIPSAYLFAGESGIGKRATALQLSKTLNCLEPVRHGTAADACDHCASCRKIDAGTHPDVLVIRPDKGEIRISEIRAVGEELSLKPFEGRRKVVIIDEADTMNQAAANAFLKTLEEPPEECMVILVTAHPDRLPDTIRSRCSCVRFTPLAPDACRGVITAALANQAKGKVRAPGPKSASEPGSTAALDDTQVSVMVRLSMGRPGIVLSSDPLKERSRFIALLDSMLKKDNEMWSDREEMEAWIDKMLVFLRDMAVLKVADETAPHRSHERGADRCRDLVLNADMHDLVVKIGKKTDMKEILGAYNALASVRRRVDFNLNKAITWNYSSTLLRAMVVHGS